MMSPVRVLLVSLALLFGVQGKAFAEPVQPGRWALRSGSTTLLVLELRKQGSAGQWIGTLERPSNLQFRSGSIFEEVRGPSIKRPVLNAKEGPDALEFSLADSRGDLDQWTWRPTPTGGELQLKDAPIEAWPFENARRDEQVTQAWDAEATYAISRQWQSNGDMKRIFEADQAARHSPKIDWSVVGPADAERRKQTQALLDSGALQSGNDFYHAAFIFQHGGEAKNYLLAHTLAMIAAARGRPDATWIAAATLDRYLQAIGQKQIYGTQYSTLPGKPTTQDPYDPILVSDALREVLGIPNLADQEKRRKEIEARHKASMTVTK